MSGLCKRLDVNTRESGHRTFSSTPITDVFLGVGVIVGRFVNCGQTADETQSGREYPFELTSVVPNCPPSTTPLPLLALSGPVRCPHREMQLRRLPVRV